MGCGSPLKDVYNAEPNLKHWLNQFKTLGIQEIEIIQLFELYQEAKGRHSLGKLEVLTVFKILEIDRLKFMFKAFAVFRPDKNEELFLDFRDFAITLWNFCTMNSSDIAKFAFDLYDIRRSGKVDVDTLSDMLKDLYGYEYRNNDVAKTAVANLQNLRRTKIEKAVFLHTVEKTPRLFHIALRIQSNVRRKAIDHEFWQRMSTIRYGLPEGKMLGVFIEVNPEYCGQKIATDTSLSKSRRSARVADQTTGDVDDDDDDGGAPDILRTRVFKRPVGESRIAKHKAFQNSRANAMQRALALDQIKKDRRLAEKAAKESSASSSAHPPEHTTASKSKPDVHHAPSLQAPPPTGPFSMRRQRSGDNFFNLHTHVEGRHEESDHSYSDERKLGTATHARDESGRGTKPLSEEDGHDECKGITKSTRNSILQFSTRGSIPVKSSPRLASSEPYEADIDCEKDADGFETT